MPPRRIAPPSDCVDLPSGASPRRFGNAPRLILDYINSRPMDPVVKHDTQARASDKVMSVIHERVIPRVGNAARVHEWIERAQHPFTLPGEEDAFFAEVAAATGNDEEFLFMLRWGLMASREGEEAVVHTLLKNMFSAPQPVKGTSGGIKKVQ